MTKGRIVVFAALILSVLLFSVVSADLYVKEEVNKDYTQNYDTWVYKEDLKGGDKGFTITHYYNSPTYEYKYEDEYPYVTWGVIRTQNNYRGYDRYYKNDDYTLNRVLDTYSRGREVWYDYQLASKYRNSYSYRYPYNSGYYRNYW